MKQLRRFREVIALKLEATDGELGAVEDVYVDGRSWAVRYLIVKTGGWLLGRQVLITPAAVRDIDDKAQALRINLTRAQIEHAPPVDPATPVSREYEESYYRYFRLAPYWDTVPGPWQPVVLDPAGPPAMAEPAADPHLESAAAMTGYAIRAKDGEIGHVEDLVVDDQDWLVRYVEVDTKNWLPGKKVLVQTSRIHHINRPDRSLALSLTREAIQSAPAYDPSQLITPDYEVKLFKYYGKILAA